MAMNSSHILTNSVIYDSGATVHVTNDPSRAIEPIRPCNLEIDGGGEPCQAVEIATIRINADLNGKPVRINVEDVYRALSYLTTSIAALI